jgi:thiamine monophosphate synthase
MARMMRSNRIPFYALGGIDDETIKRIRPLDAAGVGLISAWFSAVRK